MKKNIVLLALATSVFATHARALDTKLYESEEVKTETFSAKVKSVREAEDGVDVTFESNVGTGFYSLSRRKIKNYDNIYANIEKSKRPKGSLLKVTAEKDDKIIISVSVVEKVEKAEAAVDLKKSAEDAIDKLLKER